MRAAHRTPAPERSPCPVGTSCGELGSEVGSIKGLANAGRCRRLCAVRGGLCARCCAVLSTYTWPMLIPSATLGTRLQPASGHRSLLCGLLGAKLLLSGLESSPRQAGGRVGRWVAELLRASERKALGPRWSCQRGGATPADCVELVHARGAQPAAGQPQP